MIRRFLPGVVVKKHVSDRFHRFPHFFVPRPAIHIHGHVGGGVARQFLRRFHVRAGIEDEIDVRGTERVEVEVALLGDGRDSRRQQILLKHRRGVLRDVEKWIGGGLFFTLPLALLAVCLVVEGEHFPGFDKRHQTRHKRGGNHLEPFLAAFVNFPGDADGASLTVEKRRFEPAQFVFPKPGTCRHLVQKPPVRGAEAQESLQFVEEHGPAYSFGRGVEFRQFLKRVFGQILAFFAPQDKRAQVQRLIGDCFAAVAGRQHFLAFRLDLRQNAVQIAQQLQFKSGTPGKNIPFLLVDF